MTKRGEGKRSWAGGWTMGPYKVRGWQAGQVAQMARPSGAEGVMGLREKQEGTAGPEEGESTLLARREEARGDIDKELPDLERNRMDRPFVHLLIILAFMHIPVAVRQILKEAFTEKQARPVPISVPLQETKFEFYHVSLFLSTQMVTNINFDSRCDRGGKKYLL
ncbi:hypothetical protein NE237_021422 [Protea cynaroides]|uniref:Uncharacterized protein n=1 Tax=Protea cynaroides TaxID=273540 RepID=A0A9Q0HCC9_9MAGN|nr:hypothetical protein NE237_021422 [Protea cynaroides]